MALWFLDVLGWSQAGGGHEKAVLHLSLPWSVEGVVPGHPAGLPGVVGGEREERAWEFRVTEDLRKRDLDDM